MYVSLPERINDLLGYNNVKIERKVEELLTYETDGSIMIVCGDLISMTVL